MRLFGFVIIYILVMPNDGQKTIYLTEEIIRREGYVAETHHLVTSDGYMLAMHRIPYKRFSQVGDLYRPVAFLMHGMFGASNSFIALGPEQSLAYNLADAGFDVWMGNARGTKNSRFHMDLDPDGMYDKNQFFDFTFEEIGDIDVAEMVDFILTMTERNHLHYIGHGAGGTAFLVLNAMKPEYNEKFVTAHLLGGVGYQRYFNNHVLLMLAHFTNTYYKLVRTVGIVELFPPGSADAAKSWVDVPRYCAGDISNADVCDLLGAKEIMGPSFLKALVDFETAGGSVKEIAHYGQNIKAKSFRRWDHGTEGNLLMYGSKEPPIYDLRLVTANVTLHYSKADHLVHEKDAVDMAKALPNGRARKVPRDSFHHFDYVVSRDVRLLVNDYIVSDMIFEEHAYSRQRPKYNPWYLRDKNKQSY